MKSRISIIFLALMLGSGISRLDAGAPRTIPVSTSDELQNALAAPQEGDTIVLADGTYSINDLSGPYAFFFIVDPGVHFTIKAENWRAAILDGGGSGRILEYRVDTIGQEGWVSFEGLVFQNGRTTSFDAGGVITRGGKSTFTECSFLDNQARPDSSSGASAGAVMLTASSISQFINCDFERNSSDNHGGAMLIGEGSQCFIHNSIFNTNRNNLVNQRSNALGGAIHVFNGLEGTTTKLYLSNSSFWENQGGFAGGAIMAKGNFASPSQTIASPTLVVVANCTFDTNIALNDPSVQTASPTEGGAIMAENNVTLEVFNSRFYANSAALGGAIGSYRASVSIQSSIFANNTAFGRDSSNSAGQGGAIEIHANDSCSDDTNYPTGDLTVSDSYFETNAAQNGGAIFAAGDTNRVFSTVAGCQLGTVDENRIPVTISQSIFKACSVDDLIGNNALGGALYGNLMNLNLSDSVVIDSRAYGTDPSDITSSSKGLGGGVAFRKATKASITGTTFQANTADHEGGALHIFGSEIAAFSGNSFIRNEINPGSTPAETSSKGAAIYTSPSVLDAIDVTGSINDSIFSDQIGLPVFDSDTSDSNSCGCFNLLTYDGNEFFNSTYTDSVYRDSFIAGTLNASELNSAVVDHGGGTMTPKSLEGSNVDQVTSITVAALRAVPLTIISNSTVGGATLTTDSYLTWALNGGCAQLDLSSLDAQTEATGSSPAASGSHELEVWADASCTGTPDKTAATSINSVAAPAVHLFADPISIAGGEQSNLSWSLTSGDFIAGIISNEALPEMSAPSGSLAVTPAATTNYRLIEITKQGGNVAEATVWVDEPPPDLIFSDDFESGNFDAWSFFSG